MQCVDIVKFLMIILYHLIAFFYLFFWVDWGATNGTRPSRPVSVRTPHPVPKASLMEHVLAVHELPDPLRGVVLVAELFHTYHALAVVILLLERGTVVPYGVRLNTIHAGDAYRGQFDAGGGIAVSRIFGGKGANFAAGGIQPALSLSASTCIFVILLLALLGTLLKSPEH